MNNKQVPEEIITDAFQISEDLKNGNIHNNRQFVQLSHVKELVASLPAEPSTPETKDKPAMSPGIKIKIKSLDHFKTRRAGKEMLEWWKADTGKYPAIGDELTVHQVRDDGWIYTKETRMYWPPEMFEPATGSGGGAEERKKRVAELYEANRPKFHDWGTLKDMCIATAIQYADEYAQCRQPTGTIAYVKTGKEATDYILQEFEGDKLVGEYFVKPIQIMPEREGCLQCAGQMVEIRGRYPKQPKRIVCPTCLADTVDGLQDSHQTAKNFTKPSSNPPEKE